MKIVHVITRMIVGGASENTLFSALGQARIPGNEVILLTGRETGEEGDLLEGFRGGIRIVYVPNMVRAVDPRRDPRALRALRRFFRTERPDLVHTHSSKGGVLGRVAARTAGVPAIVHTFHGLVFHEYQPGWVNRFYLAIERAMVPFTSHFVSVADAVRERAIAARLGRPEQHSTIRSGFETDRFVASLTDRARARSILGLPDDRVVIGVVGRLFDLKGQADVIEATRRAIARAPQSMVAVVGSGPLQPALERGVRDAGLDGHVRFVGRVPSEQVPVAFSAFDIVAHASLREGLARVLPQAVLAGVPVVCYDLDGASEVISDGENGFLVPPQDLDAMADRLARLAADPDLRATLGGRGRDGILESYSVDRMVTDLDGLYRRLLRSRGSAPLIHSPRRRA